MRKIDKQIDLQAFGAKKTDVRLVKELISANNQTQTKYIANLIGNLNLITQNVSHKDVKRTLKPLLEDYFIDLANTNDLWIEQPIRELTKECIKTKLNSWSTSQRILHQA